MVAATTRGWKGVANLEWVVAKLLRVGLVVVVWTVRGVTLGVISWRDVRSREGEDRGRHGIVAGST